jgi:hypothetical protein
MSVEWDDPRVVALARGRCRVINGIPCDGPRNTRHEEGQTK